MKKTFISLAFALLSFGAAFASPQFKELNNKNGKTTIKIEFPESDLSQFTVIKDWRFHNGGKAYDVKKVDVKGDDGSTFVLEFKRFTEFSDCSLSFTINGKPVSINIQEKLTNH